MQLEILIKDGITVKEYIISVRCSKAAEFLLQGHNVSEAAYMSGYPDVFAFSKMFRKVMGMSPSEYKKINDQSVSKTDE